MWLAQDGERGCYLVFMGVGFSVERWLCVSRKIWWMLMSEIISEMGEGIIEYLCFRKGGAIKSDNKTVQRTEMEQGC